MAASAADLTMHERAPDYFQAIAAATKRLSDNSRSARDAVYEKARRLLMEEAQAADPPWQLVEIVREQRALEEAIGRVESMHAAEAAMRAAEAARPRPPVPQLLPPKLLPPPRPPTPPREWVDEALPLAEDDFEPSYVPEPRHARPARRRAPGQPPPERRRLGPWLAAGALVLAGGIAALFLMLPLNTPAPPPAIPPQEAAKITPIPEISPEERSRRVRESIERGNERSRANDFDAAIAAYTEAIRLVPTDASIYNNRAFAYWSRGMTDRAIADYDETLRLEPDNIVARTNRAVAYNFRGDYELAIRDLDHALKLRPDSPDVLNSRCWGRALAGMTDLALADCNAALKLRPNDPNTLDSRGFAYLKAGQNDRAIADYDAALNLDSRLAGALYGRGIAKVRKGDTTGGNIDLASARAMRPELDAIFARYGIR
jgi:tetratricopeptide (TPR) repeat protein